MKIPRIVSSSNSKSLRKSPAETCPNFMGKITPGGSLHPLTEKLQAAVYWLYKGQSEVTISEKSQLKFCSDLLNNYICEWVDKSNFKRFAEIDQDILEEAILRLPDMIETQEELKSYLLPYHLKRAVQTVCGGYSYSQAVGIALAYIERGITSHYSISRSVWNAAMKFSPEQRQLMLGITPAKDDNGHEISGLQLRGQRVAREGNSQRCDDSSAVCTDSALTS